MKARIRAKLAGIKQNFDCGTIVGNALRLFDTFKRLFGVFKAAGEIKPKLLHVHEDRSVLPYACLCHLKKLVVESFYIFLFYFLAVFKLADERGVRSKPASEHYALRLRIC